MENPTIETIKIAPDLEEINVDGCVIATDFNGMHIQYTCERKWEPNSLKKCFQTAIALSSKIWQLENLMNMCKVKGKLEVTELTV